MSESERAFLPRRLLNIEEAAAFLSIPKRTLQEWVTQRRVPHTRVGKHVRFTPTHLEQIISAGACPVAPPRSSARSRL